jgi:hypothetical protein
MAVSIECTRNTVSTSHSWCHSWNTYHVKLLVHGLFTTVHRFVYFGCQWNAVTGLSSKLHLSVTCLLSYQLPIPVNTSSMFALWIYHFRIFVPLSLLLKPSAEGQFYTPTSYSIVSFYCSHFIYPSRFLSCGVSIPPLFFCPSPRPNPPAPSPGKLFPFLPGSNAL